MQDNFAVQVRNVVKNYGSTKILKGLSMEVEKGQIYGLLGASGCGKSTLMSSLVGLKKVDSGDIWVLGKQPGKCDMGAFGARIGYMPQEKALVDEFTVKDSIYYFGRIFRMKDKVIARRFRELQILLELPPENRYLKDCSGGEQRRVSLAVSLVHTPELLIMDEPTVGVEPVMRFRIWNHLLEITRKENISIVLTTHYLEECREADRIGLIRNGKLLAEDSPNEILTMFNCKTLEDAFFILSERQEREIHYPKLYGERGDIREVVPYQSTPGDEYPQNVASDIPVVEKRKSSLNKRRLLALLDKNWKQFHRNMYNLAFLLMLPVLQQIIFMNTLGNVRDIPLGIVNEEVLPVNCSDFSANGSLTISYDPTSGSCHFRNISCRFLEYLDNEMLTKVYFNTIEEGIDEVKRGSIVGLVYMSKNFSETFEKRMSQDWSLNEAVLNTSEIKVWMDMSNFRIGAEVQMKLLQFFLEFEKSVYSDCELPVKLAGAPLNMSFIYGRPGEQYIVNMIPSGLVSVIFFIGALMTTQVMVKEREDGIWDRSVVAGVTSAEILTSHFILLGVLSIIQTLSMFLVVYGVYRLQYEGSMVLMIIIVYMQAVNGMGLGFLVSVIASDHRVAILLCSGSFMPMMMLNGLLWPIDGMPEILQFIARCLPFTLATESLRNVSKKGWFLDEVHVIDGIAISTSYTIFFAVMSLYLMKKRS